MKLISTNILVLTDEELLEFYTLLGGSSQIKRCEYGMSTAASSAASILYPKFIEAVKERGLLEKKDSD